MKQYTHAELKALAEQLSDWQLVPAGTEGYRTAEVTLGGSIPAKCRRKPWSR